MQATSNLRGVSEMPTLNIQGKRVKVDDSFLQLSPEEQNRTVDEIAQQIGVAPQQTKGTGTGAGAGFENPIRVELPDGSIAEFPEGTSNEVMESAIKRHLSIDTEGKTSRDLRSELSALTQNPAKADFDQLPGWKRAIVAAGDTADLAVNGITMGFGNKGSALLRSAVTGQDYDGTLEEMRARTEAAGARAGKAGTAAELGGALLTPMALAGRGVTLAGRFGTGAMTGAKGIGARAVLGAAEGAGYGGLSAAGNDGDIGTGALVGGVFGGAIPVVAGVGRAVIKPVADAIGARINPEAYASRKIGERLSATMTPEQAATKLRNNPGTNLADVGGESVQGLLRTATNIPGPARNAVGARLTMRQFGQGDRLKSAIAQTFADPDGYLAAKDSIAEAAKQIAAPLYRKAYANPVHFSETLEGILSTPAGKQALQHAEQLAANEQVPFQQLFVNVANNGSATVKRVPDTRGWDYIKRAMDDMIEGQTDSITKKVTNEGRILTALKSKMLGEVDRLNPDYKAARQAFAGQAQLDEALEAGRDVFKASPEAFKRTVAGMTDAQKASARVGAAETLRAQIDTAGATNNAVLRIFSKPQQVRNLQALFETPEKFAEFRKTIFAEARKRATYQAVKGNSTTIRQAADMAEAGGLQDGFEFAKGVATGRPINATLQWVGSRLKMLGGFTPEVANSVAKQLMASEPRAARSVLSNIQRIEQMQVSAEQKRQAVQAFLSRALAIGGGMATAESAR